MTAYRGKTGARARQIVKEVPEIEWEDPPQRPKSQGAREARAVQASAMKANPGRWLIWTRACKSRTVVTRLRRAGFEATSVSNEDGTVTIYARWPKK